MAKASGVEPGTIRVWFQRGHISLGLTDKEAEGNGFARLFSARTVLLIAIMGALTKLGVEPRRAGEAAFEFCYGDGDITTTGGFGDDDDFKLDRLGGYLCAAKETILVVTSSTVNFSYVLPINNSSDFYNFIENIHDVSKYGATFIPLHDLVNNTRLKLGLPQDISS